MDEVNSCGCVGWLVVVLYQHRETVPEWPLLLLPSVLFAGMTSDHINFALMQHNVYGSYNSLNVLIHEYAASDVI